MSETIVTKENFQKEVLEAEKTVLVDFWAEWCGPCKMLAPVLKTFAEENPNVKVCKINVDEQAELAEQFNVMSIPSLVVFKAGQLSRSAVGYQTVDMLKNLTD
ncbi:MAG: thioredoxin [Treponema sp.]|nr:thioredoxin [Treponema sp.]